MFIKIHCVDYMSDYEKVEYCLFRGIRYDSRLESAVLSTEHENHDYVFPISPSHYDALMDEIETAIKADAKLITLEKGKVFRCRKGQIRRDSLQDQMRVVF